jgi:ferredoxin
MPDSRLSNTLLRLLCMLLQTHPPAGEPLSKWMPTVNPSMAKHTDPAEDRAVFVDENTCIGCKQCVWHASATFRIEDDYGRSRVYAQWLDPEDKLQDAIGE